MEKQFSPFKSCACFATELHSLEEERALHFSFLAGVAAVFLSILLNTEYTNIQKQLHRFEWSGYFWLCTQQLCSASLYPAWHSARKSDFTVLWVGFLGYLAQPFEVQQYKVKFRKLRESKQEIYIYIAAVGDGGLTCVGITHQSLQRIRVHSLHLDLLLFCFTYIVSEHCSKIIRHCTENQPWNRSILGGLHIIP